MPNLLLKKNKKEIFRELLSRFFIAILFFLFITTCISTVMLIPSYALTLSRKVSISDEIKIFEQTINFRKQDSPADILNKENLKIEIIKNKRDVYVSTFISEVVDVKPRGIKIRGFFYEVNNKDGGYLVLKGESENRNILINFIESLEEKDIFSKIDFPVSNLAKEKRVDFSVKIYPK